MTEVTVRPMVLTDQPAIEALARICLQDGFPEDFLETELRLNPFARYFVVEKAGELIGHLGLWVSDHTEIINVFVAPAEQGQGIGHLLIELAETVTREVGLKFISLEVRPRNSRALALYRAHGFKKVGVRRHYYEDGSDALLYVKEMEGSK